MLLNPLALTADPRSVTLKARSPEDPANSDDVDVVECMDWLRPSYVAACLKCYTPSQFAYASTPKPTVACYPQLQSPASFPADAPLIFRLSHKVAFLEGAPSIATVAPLLE
jgi:hypothetical protein